MQIIINIIHVEFLFTLNRVTVGGIPYEQLSQLQGNVNVL